MSYLLAGMPYWITVSFPIIRIVLISLVALAGVLMIVTTLMQSNANDGDAQSIMSGSQESYYSKNKGENKNVRLSRATVVLVSTMFVCIVLYFISLIIYQG